MGGYLRGSERIQLRILPLHSASGDVSLQGKGRVSTYEKFHLRNLLVYFLHKLYDKIHQLMLEHFLRVEVRN
jgi:hypothetical protein